MLAIYNFQFRPVMTVCVIASLGALLSLGAWQLHRLEWKRDLIARVEARVDAEPIPFEEAFRRAEAGENMEYTPVRLSGQFQHENVEQIFGAYQGTVGRFSFVPLQKNDGALVYVNRGFTPQSQKNEPVEASEQAEVSGLFRYAETPAPPASWFRPAEQSVDGLWFVRDPALFAKKAGLETSPYYIDQFAVPGQEWPRGGTTRLVFNNRHLEYALTWFGLALTLIGVWLAFSLKKR